MSKARNDTWRALLFLAVFIPIAAAGRSIALDVAAVFANARSGR